MLGAQLALVFDKRCKLILAYLQYQLVPVHFGKCSFARKKIKDIISLDQEKINLYGKRGHQFIQQKYNWELEEKKLFKLYEDLIN